MAEGRVNDFTVSARLPICLFADVVAAFEKEGYPDPRGSASAVIRASLELVRNSLTPNEKERFQESSTALSFLTPRGYSMKQVGDINRNRTLIKSLQRESLDLEKKGDIGIPWIEEANRKLKEEHPDEYLKIQVQNVLGSLVSELRDVKDTVKELAKFGVTLDEAIERYDEGDTVRRFLDASDIV